MGFHYSQPFESLITARRSATHLATARAVIVGSGYGGSVAAFRLANPLFRKGEGREHDVIVLERGKEYTLGEFPGDLAEIPGHVHVRRSAQSIGGGNEDALFDIRIGEGVDALVGSGLGGTSLINANVALRPAPDIFQQDPWPAALRAAQQLAELDDAFAKVSAWLGVADEAERHTLAVLPKYQALARYARALGLHIEPAPVTVTLGRKQNAAGITQEPCTHCGNCITGCNVGAKNTLAMNLIPAAEARGAQFYTGAMVYSVEPVAATPARERHWRVYVKPVSRITRARFDERFFIEADTVILAAGAFGSTEILQRSERLGYIRCSEHLGKRFSTNGDGLSMSFAENDPVHAVGSRNYLAPARRSGPTITACASAKAGSTAGSDPFLLEDGAIPAALLEIIGEAVTTAAQFGRFGYNRLPAWFANRALDPLAVHHEALEHSQVLLIMSDDGARGELRLHGRPSPEDPQAGAIVPVWNPAHPAGESAADSAHANPALRRIEARLAKHDRESGLNGGQYVHNPLWKAMPDAATHAVHGRLPGGRLLTVHPLGGCPMGNTAQDGVVNHAGQVFDAADGSPYVGLYVMDGSIVPAALGVNPFLTIAALAWRACNALVPDDGKTFAAKQPQPRHVPAPSAHGASDAEIVIREQLVGRLEVSCDEDKERLSEALPTSARWFEHDRLILRVATLPAGTHAALTGSSKVQVIAQLYESPVSGDQAHRWRTFGVPSLRLEDSHVIATGAGTLTVMEPVPPRNRRELLARRRSALRAYSARRAARPLEKQALKLLAWLSGPVADRRHKSAAEAMLSVAEMQSTYRRFAYDLKLKTTPATGARSIRVTGEKWIAWADDKPRLWQSLMRLDATFDFAWPAVIAKSRLYVDMDYVMGEGLLAAASDRNTPHALFNCLAYAMRLARGGLQAGFWELSAPEYPRKPVRRRPHPPARINGVRRITHDLQVEKRLGGAGAQLTLELHQYGSGGPAGPVLLLHGLAQGSLIFAHEKLPISMAAYLLGQGYDVWLLDHRLSNRFDAGRVAYDGWSIDEIGAYDVPAAVDYIWSHAHRKIHVFAHCIGAAAVSMAILARRVGAEQLASVALNAIHPWVMPSPYNNVRAKLGVVFRDLIGNDCLDPIIQSESEVGAAQVVLDRLAYSLSRLDEAEADEHSSKRARLADAICDRMTFLYGRMWRHANVADIHRHWADLVGRAPGAVYRHLYYLLTTGRVVDREGKNVYLTPEGLRNWLGIRTLFMHGEDSHVFNPQSATRSAIRLKQAVRTLQQLAETNASHAPATTIRLRRVPGYGHMDVLFAKDAAERSFQYIDAFFRGRFDSSDVYRAPGAAPLAMDRIDESDDPDATLPLQPACGPVLRGVRMQDGHLIARFWLKKPLTDVAAPAAHDLLEPKPLKTRELPRASGVDERYCWLDAEYDRSCFAHFPDAWLPRLERLSQRRLEDCHFIVASCRYPGTPFDRELSDQSFAAMAMLLARGEPCDALFLVGDQIYADASAGLFDPVSWRDRYFARYLKALRSPRMRDLLRKIPTHFTIDDHEIANDYTGVVATAPLEALGVDALKIDVQRAQQIETGSIDATQLDVARMAARSYIGSARDMRAFGASRTRAGALWYALDDRAELNCPAFVLDTRSERQRMPRSGCATMLSPEQLAALMEWLGGARLDPRPKFIFSGSVIAPLERNSFGASMWMREDGFAGYPQELETIVRHIVTHAIERVVFVGGDLHLSCVAQLSLQHAASKRQVKALQIVSSGLYSPFVFANTQPEAIDWGVAQTIELGEHAICYVPRLLSTARSHFVKVGAAPAGTDSWQICATAYDKNASAVATLCAQL